MNRIGRFGVIGLIISMGLINLNSNFAGALVQSISVTSTDELALAELLPAAKSAQAYAAAHPSQTYPGLASYLDRLIDYAEADEVRDPAALAQAIQEALIAVPLLLPEEAPATTTNTVALDFHTADPDVLIDNVQPAAQDDSAKSTQIASASDLSNTSATTDGATIAAESTPEVPLTGKSDTSTPRQASFDTIALAGLVVLIATLGATLLIVRRKKY